MPESQTTIAKLIDEEAQRIRLLVVLYSDTKHFNLEVVVANKACPADVMMNLTYDRLQLFGIRASKWSKNETQIFDLSFKYCKVVFHWPVSQQKTQYDRCNS